MFSLPKTLAMRLALLYAAVFALLSGTAFIVAYLWIAADLDARIDADLREDIVEFEMIMRAEGLDQLKKELLREARSDVSGQTVVRLFNRSGEQLLNPGALTRAATPWDEATFKGVADGYGPVLLTVADRPGGEALRIVLGRVGPGLVVEIGESLEEKEEVLELLAGTFAAVIVAVTMGAAVVGWLMSKAALKGVEEVSRAAEDVARGNFDRRVSIGNRGREIDGLAETFNIMVDRIRTLVLEMRVMTDNIAHDLRSPLTRLRASVESALLRARSMDEYQAASEQTLEECDRLLQMINATLDITEAEGQAVPLKKQVIDLSQVIREAAELFEPVAEDNEINLSLMLDSDCRINGHLPYLQRMVSNLLDNAIKYTPKGGDVSVETTTTNGFVRLRVSDTGIGIDPRDQTRVFDRFYRCDESRSKQGFGLGLSFVRAVTIAHGGKLELESVVNSGSRFTVSFPTLSPHV